MYSDYYFEGDLERITKSVEKCGMTHLENGDMSNGPIISYLESNKDQQVKIITKFLSNVSTNPVDDMIDIIFNSNLDDDQFRKISIILSFYHILRDITGKDAKIEDPQLIYFALLVNWNVCNKHGIAKIRSISALYEIKDAYKDQDLDYRDYIANTTEDTNGFKGEYKTFTVDFPSISSKLAIKLPIIKKKFGTFKFCTENVAGRFTFTSDNEQTEHIVPTNIWMKMIQNCIKRGRKIRFALETKHIENLFDVNDTDSINNLLKFNDFHSVYNFMKMYEFDNTKDSNEYEIIIKNTAEPPELEPGTAGLEWMCTHTGTGRSDRILVSRSKKYYVATTYGNAVNIWMQ